jgi:hypothetical protein
MADLDAELVTGLKQAKSKKMFFAFIPKGGEGKLIVSKTKVRPKDIATAKKEIGGGSAVVGKCIGPLNDMVFEVAKEYPDALGNAIKKSAKRDAGLMIVPTFKVAGDAEEGDEDEAGDDTRAEAPKTPAASEAPPADVDAKEEAPADEAAPAPALDLGPWQAARQNAVNGLKALAAKVAATKHGSAAGVVKEISGIIAKLPASPAPNAIDKLEDFVRNDDTITAVEEMPDEFHDLDIRKPLLDALAAMKQ